MSYINSHGYEVSYIDGKELYVHRLKVEKVLGRKLHDKEVVHHVDYDRGNNKNRNFVVCPDQAYHKLLHAKQRIIDMGGSPSTHLYCSYHMELHDKSEFTTNPQTWSGHHNLCRKGMNEYRKTTGLSRSKFNWRARMNQQYRRVINKYTKRAVCMINPKEVCL